MEYNYTDVSRIRVRYSTIVNFLSHLFKLVTSTLFVIIITRRLDVGEYGVIATLTGITSSVSIIYSFWNWFTDRMYARGRSSYVATAFSLSLIYAPIGYVLALIWGYYYTSTIGIDILVFALGSLIVVINAFNIFLRRIVLVTRPYIIGYVGTVRSIVRVLLVYTLLNIVLLRVIGVVLTLVISLSIATTLYYVMLRLNKVYVPLPSIDKEEVKRVFKNAYIPLTTSLTSLAVNIDKPVLTALTASTEPAAYLNVAYIPYSIVTQGVFAFTSSLKAKLLRVPSSVDIEDVLRLSIIINLGLISVFMFMGKTVLSMLNPEYIPVYSLFLIFTAASIIRIFASIFATIVVALERKDLYADGLALVSTPLYKVLVVALTTSLLRLLIGVAGAIYFIYIGSKDPIQIITFFPIGLLIADTMYLIYSYREAIKKIKFRIPYRELVASLLGITASGLVVYINKYNEIVIESFLRDISKLLFAVSILLAIYFLVVLLVSPWFRRFIINSIKRYIR